MALRVSLVGTAILVAGLLAAPAAQAAASFDDVARYLAGLEPAGSELAPLMREHGWRQHAALLDATWSELDQRQLSKIRAWSAANITAPQPVAYYMFSGPDFLYVDAFLPNRSTFRRTSIS